MAIARPFAYNTGAPIPGTEQVGSLAVGVPTNGFASTGIAEWWNGPDEELGYVIAESVPSDTQPTPVPPITASVGFFRSSSLTEISFVNLTNQLFNQVFLTGDQCKTYLNANGYWTSWGALPGGMVLYLDTGVSASYSGSGSTWYDLSGYGNNGTIHGAGYTGGTAAALIFNGTSSDYVDFSSVNGIPIGNEPYTISIWFNSNEMPSIRGFIGWGEFGTVNAVNAWRLQNVGGNSGFVHYWWGNDLTYATPMSTGVWYNAIAAYQNGTRKIYLNNVKVAEDTPTGHNVPYATNMKVGVSYPGFNEWFYGEIAQVVIYKRQATEAEITAIWNSGKNRFGYGTIVESGLIIQLDANDPSSYPGTGTTVYDITGSYNHTLSSSPFTILSGVKCFDCNGVSSKIEVNGTGPTLPTTGYTYITWARIKSSSADWRTLFRTLPDDHPILVEVGTDRLGFYDNGGALFQYSGYDVTSIEEVWVQYAVVGDNSSSIFYINGSQVGTTAYGAGGNDHWVWGGLGGGLGSQSFGYVANMYLYDRKLSLIEITQQYNYLSPRFS